LTKNKKAPTEESGLTFLQFLSYRSRPSVVKRKIYTNDKSFKDRTIHEEGKHHAPKSGTPLRRLPGTRPGYTSLPSFGSYACIEIVNVLLELLTQRVIEKR
jgi:hypothetical protein